MDWLTAVFGFRQNARWLDEDGILMHGEMAAGRGIIMLATPTPDYEGPLSTCSHCERAAAWSRAPWVPTEFWCTSTTSNLTSTKRKREGRPCCHRSSRDPMTAFSTGWRIWKGVAGCSCSTARGAQAGEPIRERQACRSRRRRVGRRRSGRVTCRSTRLDHLSCGAARHSGCLRLLHKATLLVSLSSPASVRPRRGRRYGQRARMRRAEALAGSQRGNPADPEIYAVDLSIGD